jgi:hypothetical protein
VKALLQDADFAFKSPDAAPLTPWDCCSSVVHYRQHLDQDQTPQHYLGE